MHFTDYDLVLYDIDGTLVDTGGAGMAALSEAAEQFFGAPSPTLDLAGSTDLGIVKNLLDHYGRSNSSIDINDFFELYHDRLEANLASGLFAGYVHPGVAEHITTFTNHGAAVGLLTGNTSRGADIKMKHFLLDHHFSFGAYGDDFADRNLLGPVAMNRASLLLGKSFSPQRTLVIGDTPKDIACAKAMGASCLAVATGQFSMESLHDHGATYVLQNLTKK
jgi:phosphoglycolate phosphatase-like HAD superfamily hydrolase